MSARVRIIAICGLRRSASASAVEALLWGTAAMLSRLTSLLAFESEGNTAPTEATPAASAHGACPQLLPLLSPPSSPVAADTPPTPPPPTASSLRRLAISSKTTAAKAEGCWNRHRCGGAGGPNAAASACTMPFRGAAPPPSAKPSPQPRATASPPSAPTADPPPAPAVAVAT